MSIKINNDQCLLWIKDPSISQYLLTNYMYPSVSYDKKYKIDFIKDKNPKLLSNKVKDICFYNTFLRKQLVDKINEYKRDKIPRLYTLNDKWKYDKEGMINSEFANTDYTIPYFTEEECLRWVSNHLVNPRTNEGIKQNSRIYIELLYTTMQYDGLDITILKNNLNSTSSRSSSKPKNVITKVIIDGIVDRLKFMNDNDNDFLTHNVKSFDELLDVNDEAVLKPKKQKSKNTFSVSSYSSSSSSSKKLTLEQKLEQKIQLRDKILLKEQGEKKENEYNLQRKLRQITLAFDVDKRNDVFSKFKTFLLTLDKGLGRYNTESPVIDDIFQDISKADNDKFMEYIKGFFAMKNQRLGEENITEIVRGFIYNIYEQIINNPKYRLSSEYLCFSYFNNVSRNFIDFEIISKISKVLQEYVDKYEPKLDKDIIDYFKNLVNDEIPKKDVYVLHTPENGNGRDKRILKDGRIYINHYYVILYDNSKVSEHIQYRLPEGMGFLNGKKLMNKLADLKDPYFKNEAEKVIVPVDNDLNDFTYEECKNWVAIPVINPRTFKRILIDSSIYNRLLCMSYQYDCNLIPRMITSRGVLIIEELKKALKKILDAEGKPPQTREQLEKFIIDKQLQKEKGWGVSKLPPIIIGLRWKDYGGRKPKNGIDITANSKELVIAFENKIRREKIASRSSQDPVAFYVSFEKDEWAKFGITNLTKDSFIKVKAHYYIPIVSKIPEPIMQFSKYSNAKTIYDMVSCMQWVMHPNKNPLTRELIARDGSEYNEIFQSALMFDSNIQPIDITAKGLLFKKQVLGLKKKDLGILKIKGTRASRLSAAERADIINKSEICNSINNIHTDNKKDETYLYFKKKMLSMCYKYLGEKDNCDLTKIKDAIKEEFVVKNTTLSTNFIYYEDSALASIIINYEIYEDRQQNKYINHYTKIFRVYIYEFVEDDGTLTAKKKDAVDYGGVSREFFTKLFEELFCDETNKKRPFILPEESGSNRYYINPNFEPDENFRKVIKYVIEKKQIRPSYNTPADYVTIYNIIGKMLGIAVVNEEIGLPKQFSSYILSRFINHKKDIEHYDILYYYLKDFNNSSAYVNMMNEQQKDNIELCGFSFNDYYIISRPSETNPDGMALTKENYTKYILQLANHAVTKNFLSKGNEGSKKSMKKRYEALFAGFGFKNKLRIFFKKNNISIDILDKLITNEQLNQEILLEFAEKLKISVIKYVDDDPSIRNIHPTMDETEKEEKIAEIRKYMTNIITKKREGQTIEKHYEFIKRLLQFMSGFSHYDRRADVEENGYKFFYMYGADTGRYPSAHTCFYQLDFFGFPENKISAEERETYLYEKLHDAIFSAGGMDLR